MADSKLPLIFATNQTTGTLEFQNLGVTFASGSTLDLTSFLFGYEIRTDPEIFEQIASGNLLIKSSSVAALFDATGSENYLNFLTKFDPADISGSLALLETDYYALSASFVDLSDNVVYPLSSSYYALSSSYSVLSATFVSVSSSLSAHENDFNNPHQTSLANLIDTNSGSIASALDGYVIKYVAASGSWYAEPDAGFNAVENFDGSEDNAIARYDGITGQIIQNSLVLIQDDGTIEVKSGSVDINQNLIVSGNSELQGWLQVTGTINDRYLFAPGTADPAGAVVGSKYYNTSLEEEMAYDGTRTKWLSVSSFTLQSGRNYVLPVDQFFRSIDGMVMDDADRGIPVPKGTIVSLAMQRENTDSTVVEVYSNGVLLVSALTSSATTTRDDTFNEDIDAGRISFKNKAGGNQITNGQLVMIMKKRV